MNKGLKPKNPCGDGTRQGGWKRNTDLMNKGLKQFGKIDVVPRESEKETLT